MSKSFTPLYEWPTPKTGCFTGEEYNDRIMKDLEGKAQDGYGGWWPSFFPTSIGFLVTKDGERTNVMTVSCMTVMCAYPFTVGMPVFTGEKSTRGDGPRFSFSLLERSREFTLNLGLISNDMVKKVVICGSLSGKNEPDKIGKAGFTTFESRHVAPPILRECPLNFECEVISLSCLGTHTWVSAQVKAVHCIKALACGDQKLLWRSMPEFIDNHDE